MDCAVRPEVASRALERRRRPRGTRNPLLKFPPMRERASPRSPMLRYDLHCHSTHSDGLLPPADVVRRAASRGVDVLALTDHDELSGLEEAAEAARESSIMLVPGSELSVTWDDRTIHVVGLGLDI